MQNTITLELFDNGDWLDMLGSEPILYAKNPRVADIAFVDRNVSVDGVGYRCVMDAQEGEIDRERWTRVTFLCDDDPSEDAWRRNCDDVHWAKVLVYVNTRIPRTLTTDDLKLFGFERI